MRLSIEDVLTYIECPMKYVHSKEEKTLSLKEEFDEKLHKTIYAFYFNAKNGKSSTKNDIRKKWGSLWYKAQTKEEILFSNSNTERNEMGMRGAALIDIFHTSTVDTPVAPLIIGQEYTVPIGEHYLNGNIELIREVREKGRRVIELVDFRTDDVLPDEFVTRYDLAITAQSYAFRKLFAAKEGRIILHYLRRNKIYVTSRDKKSFTNYELIVNQVASSIAAKHFYPKYSLACKGCPYQRQCKII